MSTPDTLSVDEVEYGTAVDGWSYAEYEARCPTCHATLRLGWNNWEGGQPVACCGVRWKVVRAVYATRLKEGG